MDFIVSIGYNSDVCMSISGKNCNATGIVPKQDVIDIYMMYILYLPVDKKQEIQNRTKKKCFFPFFKLHRVEDEYSDTGWRHNFNTYAYPTFYE